MGMNITLCSLMMHDSRSNTSSLLTSNSNHADTIVQGITLLIIGIAAAVLLYFCHNQMLLDDPLAALSALFLASTCPFIGMGMIISGIYDSCKSDRRA